MPPRQNDIDIIFRRESVASVIINSIGAFMTFFYLNVIDPVPTAEKSIRSLESVTSFIFIAIVATSLYVGLSWGNRLKRNFRKWHTLITTGEVDIADVPEKIKQDVLNFPFYAASIAAIMWVSASIVAAYVTESSRVFFSLLGWGGFISVTLLYFVDDLVWRPIIPVFFPDGRLSKVKAFHLPIFWKLLITFFFIGILPPILLARLTWQRVNTLFIVQNSENLLENLLVLQVFILGASVAASIILAYFITQGITNPIEMLREAIGYIQKGDFDAKVEVITGDELGYLGEHFNQMTAELRQKETLRSTNVQLREQLKKIRSLEATVREQAKEAERHRMARDLHDTLTQSLHSLVLMAATSQHLLEIEDFTALSDSIQLLSTSARQSLREMRLLLHELQLSEEKQIDLEEALTTRLRIVENQIGAKTELEIEGERFLSQAYKNEIFYIVLEALNNSTKHGLAEKIFISIQATPEKIEMLIKDNGSGFSTKPLTKGMGLENMRFRAEKLGGKLEIVSSLNEGTAVRLSVIERVV